LGQDLVFVGSASLLGSAEGLCIDGNHAYVAGGNDGVISIDISDPENPTISDTYATTSSAQGVDVAGDYAYVACYTGGLLKIDITTPSDLQFVGSTPLSNNANRLCVSGGYVYVATAGGALQIVDTTGSLSEVSTYDNIGWVVDVGISGNYAYVVGGNGKGMHVVDISTPSSPDSVGFYGTSPDPDWFEGIAVAGDYAYLTYNPGTASHAVYIVDISTPSTPIYKGACALVATGSQHSGRSFLYGDSLYVACEEVGLEILDVSDPENPVHVGYYDDYGTVSDVFVDDDYVYLATSSNGLVILRVVLITCCIPPSVGDLDQGGGDLGFNYDGADLSAMINGLFIDPAHGWDGICLDEADVDFSSIRPVTDPMTVDGADLSLLIDALFIAPTHYLKNCDGTDNWIP